MFLGEFFHNLDGKGRVIIPAKFREGLGKGFIITRGLDNCLFVYPKDEWANMEEKLKSLPFTQGDARAFVRFLFSGATECEIDKQGRVLIPQTLRRYANIEKEAVIIGVSNRVEVWSKEKWEKYSQQAEQSFDQIAEEIGKFDI
ncbi:division/cell wall cluster transcriptional repressor MraZ [Proteinivorax hydrogeniformans]|uniref:Transcriptional regulator MraZ n=1 Tax=Proteinivorax hydrogeniformans TaxID=1826727 RepID=A0AAU8HPR2_9FIRM